MKKAGFLKVVCLICFALICTSCATTTRIAPENVPDEELVVVGTGSGVKIVEVDFKKIDTSKTIYLEPGIHRIEVKYSGLEGSSQGSSGLNFFFVKGVKYKVVASVSGYTVRYKISIDAPTVSYAFNPVFQDLPDFSQEVIDGVRIFENGVPSVSFTPVANIKLEYGKPLFMDDPVYEDEINLFKQYAYDLGADAVFFFENNPKKGTYPTDNFTGCAVKLDGELPEE